MGDEGVQAIAAALPLSKTLTTLRMGENYISSVSAKALVKATERSWRLTEFVMRSENGDDIKACDALGRAKQNRQLLALQGALIPGREKSGTPAEAFALADGDTALGHRIAWFLLQ
jgi:hypothetical protein